MDTPKRYHPALVTIHWLMAVLVVINLYLGIVVFENSRGQDFQAMNSLVMVHMLVGATLLVLLVIRFFVRLTTKMPPPASSGNKLLDMLAVLVHYGLYLTVLAVTVLGLIFSLQSGRFQSTFLGQSSQFDRPPGAFPNAQITPTTDDFNSGPGSDNSGPGSNNSGPGSNNSGRGGPDRGGGPDGPGGGFGLLTLHEWTAYALLGLAALHILAAIYHQFIRKDNLLARMWYGPRE